MKILFNNRQKDRACRICQATGHYVSSCPLLHGKNVVEIKNLFKEKKVCYVCLRKLDASHRAPCNKFYNTKLKRDIYRTCKCRSGINGYLCCFSKNNNSTGGTSVEDSSTRTPTANTNAHSPDYKRRQSNGGLFRENVITMTKCKI